MVDFDALRDKAEGFLGEHSEQVKTGIGKVGDFVGERVGHDRVDPIEAKLAGFVDGLAGRTAPAVPPEEVPPAQA